MRLERSRTDSKVFGLCGGIARSAGISPTWTRVAFAVGGVVTGGTLFFVYVAASLVVPKEPAYDSHYNPGWNSTPDYAYGYSNGTQAAYSYTVDSMMNQMEQQTMKREIQELRAKLARFEQQS